MTEYIVENMSKTNYLDIKRLVSCSIIVWGGYFRVDLKGCPIEELL